MTLDNGVVMKLTDEASGLLIMVGQCSENRESGVTWKWWTIERCSGRLVWQIENRTCNAYAAMAAGIIVRGAEELELWVE